MSTTSVAVSVLSYMSLLLAERMNLGVPGLWLTFKLSTSCTLLAAGVRYSMPGGPFGRKQLALGAAPTVPVGGDAVLDPRITLSSAHIGRTAELAQ
jgi:hypothetical protein